MMNIFDNQFWKQFLAIAKPYWFPVKEEGRTVQESFWSWSMVAMLLALLLVINGIGAFNSYLVANLIDLLELHDVSNYTKQLIIYALLLGLLAPILALNNYIKRTLAIDWYKWLTNHVLDKYFRDRAYYHINFEPSIENPDQRISQEIEPIPRTIINISFTLIDKFIEIVIFTSILWSISRWVAVLLVIYAIVGNGIALFFGQELIRIKSEQVDTLADYRYSLTHVRDNAESVAFYQGEIQESRIVRQKFTNVIQDDERVNGWQRNKELFTNGYQFLILLIPFIALAPLYFMDTIELGEIIQASTAASVISSALGVVVGELGSGGRVANLINRLATFSDVLEAVTRQQQLASRIETVEEDRIALDRLTLQTPNSERVLVQDLSVSVETGTGLLIVGSSGRGKSSLLRAIAGLWQAGIGHIIRPNLEEILFLPQRPYMILGTLREQMLYPNRNRQLTDEELEQVLQQVNLQDLLTRVGGFDAEKYWENILSLGEQQRLAFARVLVTRPHYIILDEATSALDLENEENVYRQLQQTGSTYISVGHRQSLLQYHDTVLEFSGNASWQVVPAQDYRSNYGWE
ncbi:ABC transporter ATP-binding protein/permease [Scytonema sp. NUACC21]